MNNKSQKYLLSIALGLVVTLGAYFWFLRSPYFEPFEVWAQSNLLILYPLLFSVKVAGILWPPLPGGVLVLGSIPIIGWFNAYLIDFGAVVLASVIAYLLAKKYGMRIIEKVFDKPTIERIQSFQIKKERELEAVFLLRLFGGGVAVEIVAYGAGLINIGFRNFLFGTIASHIVLGVPTYFFFGSLFSGKNLIFGFISAAILIILFLKFKGRYIA